MFARRLRHLVGRFVRTVLAGPKAGDRAVLEAYLGPAERELFLRLRAADRRHSIDLCERLRRDGHDDPDLLRAALLHDVGKALGDLPLPHRVVYSFCATYLPSAARWLGDDDRSRRRRPFYLARHHAAVGAAAARAAGSNPRVVSLIAGHENPGMDELSRLLYSYDSGRALEARWRG